MRLASRHSRTDKRMIIVLLVLFLLPLLFSMVAMSAQEGILRPALEATRALPAMIALSLAPTALALAAMLLARSLWLSRLPRVLVVSSKLILAIITAVTFRFVAGVLLPLVWLPLVGDYLIGLPTSPHVDTWSWYSVFPLATIAFILAVSPPVSLPAGKEPPASAKKAA